MFKNFSLPWMNFWPKKEIQTPELPSPSLNKPHCPAHAHNFKFLWNEILRWKKWISTAVAVSRLQQCRYHLYCPPQSLKSMPPSFIYSINSISRIHKIFPKFLILENNSKKFHYYSNCISINLGNLQQTDYIQII